MSTPTADQLRTDVGAWLATEWDPELSLREWRERLAASGWGCPSWPTEWFGRGLSVGLASVVEDEFRTASVVGTPSGSGMSLVAPTILEHGSDDVKRRFLRPIITGEHQWCQLFSEPGSGSDLAGLTTQAERDGDTWIINGQKVWNTSAHHADYGILLARTNWDVPKHRGITYLIIDMHQPGIEVRPLRQMNGHASFNEVFFDNARVPIDNVIGDVGNGWAVALATLAHERRLASTRRPSSLARAGRAWREAEVETAEIMRPYVWYPQRAGRPDLLIERAQAAGVNHDPRVRQAIANVLCLTRTAEWTAQRAVAARRLGRPPGPEGSLGKLHTSLIARACARVHGSIAGAAGTLTGPDGPMNGVITEILISVPAQSIAGGTDEIQRNILGERVLGLPKEPSDDGTRSFRDIPRNTRH